MKSSDKIKKHHDSKLNNKADAEDAEGKVTAAHKNHQATPQKKQTKIQKAENQWVCAESDPHPGHEEVQQDFGAQAQRRMNTNPEFTTPIPTKLGCCVKDN